MAELNSFSHCLFIFSVNLIILPILTKCDAALFLFGDSALDAGNNNYIINASFQADYFPYGETFFKYPTGRFSDGRLVPDFIGKMLRVYIYICILYVLF